MDEIRVGMTVRDAAGGRLGKVRRVYPWGFEVVRGFWSPYQWVFRHSEVVRVGDDSVDVARGPDDLQRLAAGGLPEGWGGGAPPFGERPIPSAPAEARGSRVAMLAAAAPPPSPGEEQPAAVADGEPAAAAHPHG
jgi:hypothetical protein